MNVRPVTFGSEAAPAPASGQRVRLRSLDRVSSHKQVSGNRQPQATTGVSLMIVIVAAVVIVLSGMLIALVLA